MGLGGWKYGTTRIHKKRLECKTAVGTSRTETCIYDHNKQTDKKEMKAEEEN